MCVLKILNDRQFKSKWQMRLMVTLVQTLEPFLTSFKQIISYIWIEFEFEIISVVAILF